MRRSSPASIGPAPSFHCDPPCWGCEDDYGKALFARADFTRLADQLRTIKGRFLLSINDVPEIRAIFAGFTIREVQVMYSANDKGNKQVTELLIGNFEWDGQGQIAGRQRGINRPLNRLFQGGQTPVPKSASHGATSTKTRNTAKNALLQKSVARTEEIPGELHRVIHTGHLRWSRKGIGQFVFNALAQDADNEHAMIDSTIVRAYQPAAGAKGASRKAKALGDHAAGRAPKSTRPATLRGTRPAFI